MTANEQLDFPSRELFIQRMFRKYAWIVPFVTLAFALQTLLPFFATYQAPEHTKAAQMAQLYGGDKVLICTGDGFKFVSWAELAKHPAPEHQSQYKCAICYVAAHTATNPPSAAMIANADAIAAPPTPVHEPLAVAEYDWREFLTRAPPEPLRA